MKSGRGEANVFEPTQFSIKRIYRVQWRKQGLNLDELAKLYWENGLTMMQIANIMGVGRTTVRDNLQKLKQQGFPKKEQRSTKCLTSSQSF